LEHLATEYRSPVAATLAGAVLAAGALSGTLGARRRDPGLSARLTAALLGAWAD
jgi:hypothetical protein